MEDQGLYDHRALIDLEFSVSMSLLFRALDLEICWV